MVDSNVLAELEATYVPPLDIATFLAITSEYDLSDPTQPPILRQVLDSISSVADIESATGFDPSASSTVGGNDDAELSTEECGESLPKLGSMSLSDSATSASSQSDAFYTTAFDDMTPDAKESAMVGMFPALRLLDIKLSMKKHGNDANLVIDDLMMQSFLEETGERSRGIDGLVTSQATKRKGKRRKHKSVDFEASDNQTTPSSPWEDAQKHATFIAKRTGVPAEKVKSIYHKNNASPKMTIQAILDSHTVPDEDKQDETFQLNVEYFEGDFPAIKHQHAVSLIHITHPSIMHAHELGRILTVSPGSSTTEPAIQLHFQHKPPGPDDLSPAPSSSHFDSLTDPPSSFSSLNHANATTILNTHLSARAARAAQAAAAYRRARSDNLMSGAAAYYSSLAREHDARARTAARDAADALVASQSRGAGSTTAGTTSSIDLHGIDVKNAVRIVRECVTAWWAAREAAARRQGRGGGGSAAGASFEIITGVGRHSAGGVARVGPAVARMLLRDGWKVRVGSGWLVVVGVVGGGGSGR